MDCFFSKPERIANPSNGKNHVDGTRIEYLIAGSDLSADWSERRFEYLSTDLAGLAYLSAGVLI